MPETPASFATMFKLEVDDVVVGYFESCSGLEAEHEAYSYPEGGLNTFVHQLPGRVRYRNLVLSRGITSGKELLEWFQKSKDRSSRGSVTIWAFDVYGTVEQTYAFAAAWAVKYTGPSFDANRGEMAIESLEIAHEGLVPGVT